MADSPVRPASRPRCHLRDLGAKGRGWTRRLGTAWHGSNPVAGRGKSGEGFIPVPRRRSGTSRPAAAIATPSPEIYGECSRPPFDFNTTESMIVLYQGQFDRAADGMRPAGSMSPTMALRLGRHYTRDDGLELLSTHGA